MEEKVAHSALFVNGDDRLFVPLIGMWRYRSAATAAQVLQRAGLPYRLWPTWIDRFGAQHWFFRWLYNAPPPPEIRIVYESWHGSRSAGSDEFFVDREMLAFREESRISAVVRAIAAEPSAPSRDSTVHAWLDRLKEIRWFREWLLLAADAPDGVAVATAADVRNCSEALQWRAILKELQISETTFVRWFDNLLPHAELSAFVQWLYGGQSPDEWHVAASWIPDVRNRLSDPGIATMLGLNTEVRGWRTLPHLSAALDELIAAVRSGRLPKSELWKDLRQRGECDSRYRKMIDGMLRFARATTRDRLFNDKVVSREAWYSEFLDAKRHAGKESADALLKFVLNGRRHGDERGVVAPHVFLPTAKQRSFREAARKRCSECCVPRIRSRLRSSAFELWFLTWAVPRKRWGLLPIKTSGPIIRAAGEPTEPDGPVTGYRFRWDGELYDGLNPLEWRLVKTLWESEAHAVPFQQLAEPVWEDAAILVDQNRFGGARKRANRFFKDHGIPIVIEGPAHTAVLRVETGNGKL